MFTAGRYEYRNKGVDMFIDSLAREYCVWHTACTDLLRRTQPSPQEIKFKDNGGCVHHHACPHKLLYSRGIQGTSPG